MAKPATLRERLAALKSKKAGLAKEAKVKVAAAWTIAKTMLPEAPAEIQHRFASAIVELDSKILRTAVKQAAVNAYWSKVSEDLEAKGLPLNKFVEDESFLNKIKNEVEKEIKGEAKTASDVPEIEVPAESDSQAPKIADYIAPEEKQADLDDEQKMELHSEITEAEKAIDRVEDDIMNEGEDLDLTTIFDEGGMDEKTDSLANEGEGFEGGEGMDEMGDGMDEMDMDDDMGLDGMTEEDIPVASSDESGEGQGPSDTSDLESVMRDMDEVGMSEAADFFSQSSEDTIGDLFNDVTTDDVNDAASVNNDGTEVEPGNMSDFFENSAVASGDGEDAESDHEGDLISELVMSLGQPEFKTQRNTEPEFEMPKEAKKKKASRPVRSLGHMTISSSEQSMLSKLVFPDDED